MTRKSPARLEKDGIVTLPKEKRSFTPEECMELQELNRIANARQYEAAQVKGNTALIPRGQEVAAELEAIARLLDNARNMWIGQKLIECGYPPGAKVSINLSTGQITPNEPANA